MLLACPEAAAVDVSIAVVVHPITIQLVCSKAACMYTWGALSDSDKGA
jgi:hypothetical protein